MLNLMRVWLLSEVQSFAVSVEAQGGMEYAENFSNNRYAE